MNVCLCLCMYVFVCLCVSVCLFFLFLCLCWILCPKQCCPKLRLYMLLKKIGVFRKCIHNIKSIGFLSCHHCTLKLWFNFDKSRWRKRKKMNETCPFCCFLYLLFKVSPFIESQNIRQRKCLQFSFCIFQYCLIFVTTKIAFDP